MKKIIFAVCYTLLFQASQVYAISLFMDRPSWEAAVVNFQVENFDSYPLNPGLNIISFNGQVNNGVWTDTVGPGDFGLYNSSSFRFSQPINAFGADWNTSGDIFGPPLNVFFGPEGFSISGSFYGQFIGVIATEEFTSFRVDAAFWSTSQISYSLDNLDYGNTISSIPEPSTFILLGAGLGGLILLRRRATK